MPEVPSKLVTALEEYEQAETLTLHDALRILAGMAGELYEARGLLREALEQRRGVPVDKRNRIGCAWCGFKDKRHHPKCLTHRGWEFLDRNKIAPEDVRADFVARAAVNLMNTKPAVEPQPPLEVSDEKPA
jgi:hypothetical protein